MAHPNEGDDIDVIFRPVWQANQGALDLLRCMPTSQDGKNPIAHDGNVDKTAKRNIEILDKAFTALTFAANKRSPFRLMVPVNTVCLINNGPAADIVGLAKNLNPMLRKAVIFEVFNFATNVTLDFLDDATIPLMPFFDHFIAAPDSAMRDFTVFTNCNYFAVSLNLADDADKAQPVLETFCAKAELSRLKVFAHGVSSKKTAEIVRTFVVEGIEGGCYGKDIKDLSATPEKAVFN